MSGEFETPRESKKDTTRQSASILKPLDQAIITALTLLVCSLLGWIAYTGYQNSMAIVQLDSKFESIKSDRDLNMLYVERRIAAIEAKLGQLIDQENARTKERNR